MNAAIRTMNFRKVWLGLGFLATAIVVGSLLVEGGHSALLAVAGKLGQEKLTISTGQWALVAGAIVTSLGFFVLIPVRINRDWRYHGVFAAFIISLFAEMYGFPLTAYLLSSIVGISFFEKEFMSYMYTIGMPLGAFVCTLGVLLIILGWREVYRAKNHLATTGIYAYLRHPQYLGILLVTVGWVVHWPTIPGLVLCPVLIFLYFRLAKKEDMYLARRFGDEYRAYAARTSMFFPYKRKQTGLTNTNL